MSRENFINMQRDVWDADPAVKEFDLALGCMVHHAALLEFWLYELLTALLESDHAGAVTGSMPVSAVLNAVKQIVEDCDDFGDDATKAFRSLAREAIDAFTMRNRYAHGTRLGDRGIEKTILSKDRRRGTFASWTVKVDDLYDLAAKLNSLSSAFLIWQAEYVDARNSQEEDGA